MDQSSSDPNKRQKFDQDIRTSSTDHQSMEIDVEPGSGPSSPKRPKLSTSSHSQQSSDIQENRKPTGLLTSYHGVAYQVQWMMVVALEAQKRLNNHGNGAFKFKTIDFKTEDPDAGKFDDLVWRYKTGKPNSYEYNFLQAKHKLEDGKITINELLKPKQQKDSSKKKSEKDKRPFALEKYFLSYRDEIKGKYNGEINKLIIATNIDFDDDLKSNFEPLQDNIPILDFIENKEPENLRFKKGDLPIKKKVITQLESKYDSINLVEKLLEYILKNEPVTEESPLGSYFYDLIGNKIIDVSGKFHSNFIKDKGLSDKAKRFREFLLELGFKNKKEDSSSNFILPNPEKIAKIIASQINVSTEEVRITRQRKKGKRQEKSQGEIVNANIDKLANYVLVKDKQNKVRFSRIFWEENDKELPDNLKDFRNQLKTNLINLKLIDKNDNDSKNYEKLRKYHFTITGKKFTTCEEMLISEKTFWEGMENGSIENNINEILPCKDLPEKSLNDIKEEIDGFFKRLTFVVNYSQETLDKFIKKKCSWFVGFETDYIAYEFQAKIANALNLKAKEFISTAENVDNFFKKAEDKLISLTLIGLTLRYKAQIEEYGIQFQESCIKELFKYRDNKDNQKSYDFLCSDKKVLSLVTEQNDLTSIKVYQAIGQYQERGEYIFMNLRSILLMKNHVLRAFEERDLLIIECNYTNKDVQELYNSLKSKLNGKKKIILITQEKDPLAGKFKDNFPVGYEEKKDERNSLTDLTDGSQKELLEKGEVIFQGKEVSLGTLVDDGSNHIIDGEVLSKLIKENRIKIGSKVPQKSDRGSPAYNIIMPEEIKIERFKDEDIKDDLFVISEIKEKKLINLGITEEKICSFDNCDSNDKNAKQFFLLDSKDRDKNIENFETVCHNYPDKMIHFIEFKDNKFMWNRYYDPNFHTDRKFYQIEIDVTELDKYVTKAGKKDDIFTVSGIKKEGFEKQYKIDTRVIALFKNNPDGGKPIIILNNADEEFGHLSDDDKLKDFNIHWLESKETKLFWKRSKGKTSELSRLIVSESDDCVSLLDIVEGTKSTVIADLSGTGKSTTLTLLSGSYKKDKKEKGLDWVIRVNLRDYSNEIDKLPDEYNLKKVVEFFSAIDKEGLEDTFAKNLFKHRLEKENNILLLFDGFDEISSGQKEGDTVQSADKQKKITNLLKFLKDKTTARIVVTTRPYEKEKTNLENELSILSYTFKPIENERQEFLKNFWKRSLKLKYSENEIKESQYEELAQDLIRKFNEAINEEKSRFMGIPLHLRMLAEVHLKKFEKNRQNDDFKDLNTFDLYKEFVDRKYKIYFSEKTGLSSTGVTKADLGMLREQYEKMHKRLAFKYLFSGSAEPFKLFFSAESEGSSFIENKMPNEEKTRELKRIGITQSRSKDDIDFVHRTFAEYFVSKLIYERLKQKLKNPNYSQESKDEMRKFLLNPIFIIKENNVIRSFINSELADKSANLENFWSGQIDPLKNTEQLLLAVKEGLGNIFSFLLHSEKDKGINKKLISVPRKHIEKLCDDGEYREADLFLGALKFLIEELEKDHLEIAIMQRYLGNAYGTLAENTKDESKKKKLFNKKKKFLEKALSTFEKHLVVAEKRDAKHQEDYLQQASSTFEEDLKSIRAQTAENLDENQRKVWIRVLEIEIAKAKRNLANAYGDLAESPDSQRFFEKKKELLEEKVLPTFEKYLEDPEVKAEKKLFETLKFEKAKAKRNLGNVYGELAESPENKKEKKRFFEKKKEYLEEALKIFAEELIESPKVAETKRNLGNVYGKLDDQQEKKKLLEEALPYLKEHYGLLDSKVTKAQENLSKAYKKLGYPLHGAVIFGNKDKVEEELKENVNRKTDDDSVTPLHLAVREGHSDIVKLLLLKKQIDPNIKDKNEETPLDLAKKQKQLSLKYRNLQIYQEIIDILNKHKSINQQQENHPVNQGSEVLSEDLGIKKV